MLNRLGEGPSADVLQLCGDAVAAALEHRVPEAAAMAGRMIEALQQRGWEGDSQLVDRLRAAVADTGSLAPHVVPVDLEELGGVLEGGRDSAGGWLDIDTGDVWPVFDEFVEEDDGEALGNRLWVPNLGSGSSYRDMVDFIASGVTDAQLRHRLQASIDRPHPFREFRSALDDRPELRDAWFRWRDERLRGRARAWLSEEGLVPTIRPLRAAAD